MITPWKIGTLFKTWRIADPDTTDGLYAVDWEKREQAWAELKAEGKSFKCGLRHGHTFLQLCDLRGYENLLFDMMDEEPKLIKNLKIKPIDAIYDKLF